MFQREIEQPSGRFGLARALQEQQVYAYRRPGKMIDLQAFAIKRDAVFDLAAQKPSQRFRSIGIGSRLTGPNF